MVVDVCRQTGGVLHLAGADGRVSGLEDFDLDFTGRLVDGHFVDFGAAYGGLGAFAYWEGVLGSVFAVLFDCDLVGSEAWCWIGVSFKINVDPLNVAMNRLFDILLTVTTDLDTWYRFLRIADPSCR